jgi:two-component system, cell cycle sensor histidine kinase and response regulator CckA
MICVVDDDPAIAALVARVAGRTGRKVISASPSEVLALESPEEIELVIADINLPEMSGLELVHKLRAKGVTCPLLFMSGDHSIETVDSSLRIAGAAFLPKPFSIAELQQAISAALGQR